MSRIFGELVSNRCWHHLIWQKAVAAIHIKAMKLYWRYLNLVDRRKIAKLKLLTKKLRIGYISKETSQEYPYGTRFDRKIYKFIPTYFSWLDIAK